jgi:hypothetical protein
VASLDRRFGRQGLLVVGLHSPEFDQEKVPANVRREVGRLGVGYPVVLDNDLAMWDALGNEVWPTTYLIDRQGNIRHVHRGEVREGTREALAFEDVLKALLGEAPPPAGKPR